MIQDGYLQCIAVTVLQGHFYLVLVNVCCLCMPVCFFYRHVIFINMIWGARMLQTVQPKFVHLFGWSTAQTPSLADSRSKVRTKPLADQISSPGPVGELWSLRTQRRQLVFNQWCWHKLAMTGYDWYSIVFMIWFPLSHGLCIIYFIFIYFQQKLLKISAISQAAVYFNESLFVLPPQTDGCGIGWGKCVGQHAGNQTDQTRLDSVTAFPKKNENKYASLDGWDWVDFSRIGWIEGWKGPYITVFIMVTGYPMLP